GQLFRDQALTVTYALLFSLAVALTLVPMLAAGAPPRPAVEPGRLGRVSGALATLGGLRRRLASGIARTMRWLLTPAAALTQGALARVEAAYGPLLGSALDHRGRVMGIPIMTLAASLALVPRLGSELIPQMSQGEFLLDVRLAPGATLEQTDAVVEKAEALAQAQSGVAQSYAVSGTGNRLDADPTDAGENTGRLTVTLQPGASRGDEERAIGELRQGLQDVPGAQFRYSRPALFSFDTPLEVEVIGYDLQALQQAAERVQLAMAASPLFSDVKSSVESGNPEVQILFDQDRATRLGLEVRGVADRVVSSIRGDVATRYKLRDRNIDVLVRGVDTRASSVEEIRNLVINPGSDQPVPLSAVADIRIATGPAEIRRARQERVAIVSANLAEGDLGGALVELDRIVQSISPAPGIDLQVGGQSEEMQGSFRSLEFTLIMAVFLVYLVMASQFESLLHPFVILLTIPLALVGSIWAMFLTGTTLNVVAYIGVIMLAGIVVNQSIVLIDAVNQARERGLDKREAILEAGRLRLRPILITKLTTVLGLLPMALGLGEGAEVRQPMAITVIGGVAISGLFTLLVIPVAYSLLDRKEFAPGVRP
ncbi:MAG: efflux RND transporter permease subunit, partial [Steroidobacteraceae bacterium]